MIPSPSEMLKLSKRGADYESFVNVVVSEIHKAALAGEISVTVKCPSSLSKLITEEFRNNGYDVMDISRTHTNVASLRFNWRV